MINIKVENWLHSFPAEKLNLIEESDEEELEETPKSSEITTQTGQGSQQSTSAKEPVPGRVGLQASFMPPNLPLFQEVNPVY